MSVPPPCAPAAPAAALQRQRRKRYDGCLHQVVELHELHSQLPELTAPWREAFQPVTVLCAGRIQLDQRCVVMNPRSPGLRGIFASWLRDMAGDESVTLSAFTAAMKSTDMRQLGQVGPCEVQSAIQALERFVADVAKDGDVPSFVAVHVGLRSQLGSASFQTTALWLDLSVDELMMETATALQGVKAFLETREVSGPQPLLQTLLPALQGQEALKVVICGPADDPAIGAAHDQLSSLVGNPSAVDAASCLELSSLEVPPRGLLGDLLTSAFQDLRCSRIALSEFLTGEVCLKDLGFPGHILPKLHMKYQVSNQDRVKLHLAAESAMEDFEARGWGSSSRSGVLHLADCYELPPEVLTTSSVRSFARSQDQHDPLVRTIARLRDDVSCAVALLPLCATHPFNMLRVLQLGGIHSLLALLADSSSLAERRGEAMEELSDAEISAMVLMVLCASSAIRRFLVSQGIFELMAVAVRYPSSPRQLQIFCALLVRLLRDQHRPQQLGQPLAEQLGELLQRDATLSAQAVAAASAALSPFLPVEAFEPLLPQLVAARSEAFRALCASLTLSAAAGDGTRLNVPRLLCQIPVDPPKGILFHHGALCALALCSRTAAMTSLCRPWVVSTAMALLRSAMTSPWLPLKELKVALPLAIAADEISPAPAAPASGATELNCEVEEKMRMKRTFGSTWRTATPEPDTGATASGPPCRLRKQRLLGLAQRWPREQLAASPNAADFQERPQVRLEIFDEHTELFLALSALPVCKCPSSDSALEGQMGFWICECPEEQRDHHQLDLKSSVHVSASTGAEHLVSVTLPRGLYTLVPFSSHQLAEADEIKAQCRKQLCGCVDLNLHQENLYELGTRFLYLSIWGEAKEISIQATRPWFQRLRLRWPLLTALPLWLCPAAATEVLICITGEEECSLRHSEPCLDLWPHVPHRRVRNERTGALRIHIPRLTGNLRINCIWQEPQSCERTPQLLVYSSDPLEAFAPRTCSPRSLSPGLCEMPREIQNFWQSSVLCAGSWTSGFSSGFGSLRNPQVVLEVIRGPSRGEELQLEIYLCIPARKDKEAARPKASFTVFARQEELRPAGAPERLAEGVLRRELARAKTAVGSYVMTSLSLCGAESRQQLYCVLQNDALQETWPWQLRVLARIRAKDGEAGQAGLSQPIGTPDEPPLRCAVLGGWAEPGRIYTCWPEGVASYSPKRRSGIPNHADETAGSPQHLSYAWMREEWSYEAPQVSLSSGALVQRTARAAWRPWPPLEPLPQLEAEEMDVTTQLVVPQIRVDAEDAPERPQTLTAQRRKPPAVPPLPKRLVLRSDPPTSPATETPTPRSNEDARPAPRCAAVRRSAELDAKPPETPLAPPSQLQRRARMEQLLRRRKHGRERIMPEAEFYREAVRPGRQHSASVPPGPRAETAPEGPGECNSQNGPCSARDIRSPSLPPIEQELRCCNFTGHPVFCCRAAAASEHQAAAARRHLVRLQRDTPEMQRLGFGNVVAGPPHAPVLIISWIRAGALAAWNAQAPEGMAVPLQSAIVSVNGVSGNVQKMREELRAQEVELEILAPERWRYAQVTRSA